MFKIKKYDLITICVFSASILFVMLYSFWSYFLYISLFGLSAGFALLTYRLYLNFRVNLAKDQEQIEEFEMELLVSENGEKYAVSNKAAQKKQNRKELSRKFSLFMPTLCSGLLCLGLLFFLVRLFFI